MAVSSGSSQAGRGKGFATLRLFRTCPLTRLLRHNPRAKQLTPGREERERGQGLPLYSKRLLEVQGQAKATPGQSDRLVGWELKELKAWRGRYSLRSGGMCMELWHPKRLLKVLALLRFRRLLDPVTDPVSMRDVRTGSNPVRGRCERLGVFDCASLDTPQVCHPAGLAYRCGQARGTLDMKLFACFEATPSGQYIGVASPFNGVSHLVELLQLRPPQSAGIDTQPQRNCPGAFFLPDFDRDFARVPHLSAQICACSKMTSSINMLHRLRRFS
jgi:hypothetical protein